MAALINSRIMRIIPLIMMVCLVGVAASGQTSTYVFVPDQSKLVQTGGIAGVHWTYSIKGQFQLTVDPNLGTASFAHVDANATDDSPFKRTLDPNRVFNMTSLVGTVEPTGSIKFTGKVSDGSDVRITVGLKGVAAVLFGQTTPPPNSADFFIFSLDAVAQLRKYGGGSGTAEDPYQIATAEDLIALGESPADYDKHFILTDDIDLDPNLPGGKVFDKAVIAPDTDPAVGFQGTHFTGVFDGNGHTILHLTISGGGRVGLFGQLDSGAVVTDLGLMDVNIAGSGAYVGGLVGSNGSLYTPGGSVSQCYSTGAVSGGHYGYGVGGLVGYNSGTVMQCYSTGTVSGGSGNFAGGLVGLNEGCITHCYSRGSVSADGDVGGLVGINGGTVTQCYSTSAVTGGNSVGGLVGVNFFSPITFGELGDFGTVTDSYSTGTVSGTYYVGGLVGDNSGRIAASYSTAFVTGNHCVGGLVGNNEWWATVTVSFWDIQTSGQAESAGGTGKTTAEMQKAKTFLDAGWDFVNVWGIGENQTYPYLRKYSAADINQDGSVNFLDLAVLAENWLTGIAP